MSAHKSLRSKTRNLLKQKYGNLFTHEKEKYVPNFYGTNTVKKPKLKPAVSEPQLLGIGKSHRMKRLRDEKEFQKDVVLWQI